jgi:hypothetical protein
MANPNETAALKASFRGALATADSLHGIKARVEALGDADEIPGDLLEELARMTAAHSIASAALRGLVRTILARRGATTT